MTTFLLIRHGECDTGGLIAGRTRGYHLTEKGRSQAQALAERLSGLTISALFSSPLERTAETAGYVSSRQEQLPVVFKEELIELNYGDWTGLPMHSIINDDQWRQFSRFRGAYRIPGGEMMLEVASRMSCFTETIRRRHEGIVAIVSHGDPLKALIAHYTGVPLDATARFDLQPASVTILRIDDYGSQLECLNNTGVICL